METTELYCRVGTCLCMHFDPRDGDLCFCEHPAEMHEPNVED